MTARQNDYPRAWICRALGIGSTQIVCVLLIAVSGCSGCRASKSIEISGTVVTSKGLTESFLGVSSARPEDRRVAAATIILAFDKDGAMQVKGCYAESSTDGSYSIKSGNVPPSSTTHGNDYYLIVRKEGYASLVKQISVGPLSAYNKNTVWLKRIVE